MEDSSGSWRVSAHRKKENGRSLLRLVSQGGAGRYREEARLLGAALAQAGYRVATGGGPGLMDEISRGAQEAGGTVHAVTLNQAKFPRTEFADTYEDYVHLHDRQRALLAYGDAFVAFPGGTGTAFEVFDVASRKDVGGHAGRDAAGLVRHLR